MRFGVHRFRPVVCSWRSLTTPQVIRGCVRLLASSVIIGLLLLATPVRAEGIPAVCLDRLIPIEPSGRCDSPPPPRPDTPPLWVCPGGEGGFQIETSLGTIDIPTFCLHVDE